MAHKTLVPDIWRRSIYDVDWFGQLEVKPSNEQVIQKFLHKSPSYMDDPYCDYYEDIEATAGRKKLYRRDSLEDAAPWAITAMRRGVDPPFARTQGQGHTPSHSQSSATVFTPLPSVPDKTATASNAGGSRFVEKFRESSLLMRVEDPAQYTSHYHARTDSFPPVVVDVDQPIPLPRLSEWVQADGLKGMIVHSNPHLLGSL